MIEGLGDVINSAHLHGFDGRLKAGVTGHYQYRHAFRLGNDVGAGGAGQAQVGDDKIEITQFKSIDSILYSSGFANLVTVSLQKTTQGVTYDCFVFNDQDVAHAVPRGRLRNSPRITGYSGGELW